MPTLDDDDDTLTLSGDPEASDYLDVLPAEGEIDTEEGEDGSLIVNLGEYRDMPDPESGGFYDNLAEILPETVLSMIATDLVRKIDEDKKAREERDKQYEDGLKRTGMGKDAPGGAQFEGASRVVHPMLTEACVDFKARVMKELWPPSGPVKPKILGKPTREKDEKAKRKAAHMNYQLTTQIKEARNVVETLLTQLPMGGCQFIRVWPDHRLRRIRMQFVGVDKVYLPAAAESFHSATRRTFSDTVDGVEYRMRISSGMYRDLGLPPSSMQPEQSKTQKANDKIEGVQPDILNIDGDREIYEVMSYLTVTPDMVEVLTHEEEDELYPYLITIDVQSKRVLSMYRDWEEGADVFEPIDHLFEFGFIPWRGAMAVGLPHVMAGLPGAATGALRALLDSAHINNLQGGFILKGSGAGAQNRRPNPGEFAEIEAGVETQDIRQKIMPFATKEPSNVLLQLLGFCVDAGKSVVRTSMDATAIDTNANTPVGTQLSRVEEGLVVFSDIHGRIHAAFNRLLAGIHRLNRMYLDDQISFDSDGEDVLVYRKDYEGAPDTQPTSDPTIYSDQQRIAQINAIEQSAAALPGIYDMRKIEERKLKIWKVPDPEELFAAQPKPHELNAINENLAMLMGTPVVAFPDQDHLAHLQAHLDFMKSPVLGSNPLIAPTFLPAALKHIIQHIGYHYVKTTTDLVKNTAGTDASNLISDDPGTKAKLDKLLALASQHVVPEVEANFSLAMPVIQQAMQLVQQYQPKPPVDPAAAAVQAAQAETDRKAKNDQAMGALKAGQLQVQQSDNQARTAIDSQRAQATRDAAVIAGQTRIQQTEMETDTARAIEAARINAGALGGSFKDGKSLGG